MSRDRFPVPVPPVFRRGSDVVDPRCTRRRNRSCGRNGHAVSISHPAGKRPTRHNFVVKHFAEPRDRHMEARRSDGSEIVQSPRRLHPPDLEFRQLPYRPMNPFRGHPWHLGGQPQPKRLADAREFPLNRRRQPVIADPQRPLQIPRIEMTPCREQSRLKLRLRFHFLTEKRRIEHLKAHSERSHAHTRKLEYIRASVCRRPEREKIAVDYQRRSENP